MHQNATICQSLVEPPKFILLRKLSKYLPVIGKFGKQETEKSSNSNQSNQFRPILNKLLNILACQSQQILSDPQDTHSFNSLKRNLCVLNHSLDFVTGKFLKKWLRLPKSATSAFLRHPDGLNIPSFETLAKTAQVGSIATILLRGDDFVKNSIQRKLDRETSVVQKSLVCEENLIPKSREIVEELEEKSHEPLKYKVYKVSRTAKSQFREENRKYFTEKLESLQVQVVLMKS